MMFAFFNPFCLLVSAVFLFQLWGCAQSKPAPVVPLTPNSGYWEGLITEAKAEADRLRSQLATERITFAKQRAEVQSARKDLSSFREREAEFAQKMASAQTEISSLKSERDQLRRQNSELHGKADGLPQILELIQEIRTVHSSINGIVSSVKALTTEVAAVKQDLQIYQAKAKTKAGPQFQTAKRSGQGKGNQTVRVQRGDSLWTIAQKHGTTIDRLMELNDMDDHVIYPGEELHLPSSGEKGKEQTMTETAATASEPTSHQENP